MKARATSLPPFLLLAAALFGCNETPADLREWKVADHDHTANPNADQVQVTDAGAGASDAAHGLDDVTIVAWQTNCTSCHGKLGRGDGPQGQLLHASDLSKPEWQASVTDDAIASTIRTGRGRMPAFNLPEATITRLVALVRMLDVNRMQQAIDQAQAQANATAAPAHAASGAPAHSTAPAAGSATAPQRVGR